METDEMIEGITTMVTALPVFVKVNGAARNAVGIELTPEETALLSKALGEMGKAMHSAADLIREHIL